MTRPRTVLLTLAAGALLLPTPTTAGLSGDARAIPSAVVARASLASVEPAAASSAPAAPGPDAVPAAAPSGQATAEDVRIPDPVVTDVDAQPTSPVLTAHAALAVQATVDESRSEIVSPGAPAAAVQGSRPVAEAVAGRGVPGRLALGGGALVGAFPENTNGGLELLDGPVGVGTVPADQRNIVVGKVTNPTDSSLTVAVLALEGTGAHICISTCISPWTVAPVLVAVAPHASEGVLLAGPPGSHIRFTVRTLRTQALSGSLEADVTLNGFGDVVALPLALPAGAPGAALRATSGDLVGVSLGQPSLDDPRSLVLTGPSLTTAQGLVSWAETGLPTDQVLVWSRQPGTSRTSVRVLPALDVEIPAGQTVHAVSSADQPVLLHQSYAGDARATYTVLAQTRGTVVNRGAPVGLPAADGGRPTYLLQNPTRTQVTSYEGDDLFGAPAATDVTVHGERLQQLAVQGSTSLQQLDISRPGMVFRVSTTDLASGSWFLDTGAATTVAVDVCVVVSGVQRCQPYGAGKAVEGLVERVNGDDVLLVPHPVGPDARGTYADTGRVAFRLAPLRFDTPVGARATVPHGTAATVSGPVAGFDPAEGRLVAAGCGAAGALTPDIAFENTSGSPLQGVSVFYEVRGSSTVDGEDLPLQLGSTSYPVDLAAFDGARDGAGPSGSNVLVTVPENYRQLYPWTSTALHPVPLADATHSRTISATVQPSSSFLAFGSPGQGVVTIDDRSHLELGVVCAYAYVPAVTA